MALSKGYFCMSSSAILSTPAIQRFKYSTFEKVGRRSVWWTLAALLLLALPLRVYWMVRQTPVISLEGSEYVRMADSLVHGKGLVGNFEGPETMYTPLFSVLTAGLSMLTRDSELAAHLISLLFGTALIIPVCFVARKMYGPRVAAIAGLFVAFHPVLVKLSASVYNENLYFPLLISGVYFTMESFESAANRNRILAGLCFGLAYLTRPEAFAYPILLTGALWLYAASRGERRPRRYLSAAIPLAMFPLIAAPYISFLYIHTGHFRLEGKWNINFTIANRIRSGMDYDEAAYGLGPKLTVAGPLLDPFRFAAYTPYDRSLGAKLATLWGMAKLNAKQTYNLLFYDRIVSSPLIIGLIALAWFARSWNRHRWKQELVVLAMSGTLVFLVLTASHPEGRYVLGLIPLSALWIAKGIDQIGDWITDSLSLSGFRSFRMRQVLATAGQVACLALILGTVERATQFNWLFYSEQANHNTLKDAGLWLVSHGAAGKRVAGVSTVVTYYSKATIIGLPYASSNQTLGYINSQHVDFIILDGWSANDWPEEKEWLQSGIPDNRAEEVFHAGNAETRVVIYKWNDTTTYSQL